MEIGDCKRQAMINGWGLRQLVAAAVGGCSN